MKPKKPHASLPYSTPLQPAYPVFQTSSLPTTLVQADPEPHQSLTQLDPHVQFTQHYSQNASADVLNSMLHMLNSLMYSSTPHMSMSYVITTTLVVEIETTDTDPDFAALVEAFLDDYQSALDKLANL